MKKNGELKIEKGIPIPSINGEQGTLTFILSKMEIGDSVFVPKKLSTVSGSLQYFCQKGKYSDRFKTRTEGEGIRIWRIA